MGVEGRSSRLYVIVNLFTRFVQVLEGVRAALQRHGELLAQILEALLQVVQREAAKTQKKTERRKRRRYEEEDGAPPSKQAAA